MTEEEGKGKSSSCSSSSVLAVWVTSLSPTPSPLVCYPDSMCMRSVVAWFVLVGLILFAYLLSFHKIWTFNGACKFYRMFNSAGIARRCTFLFLFFFFFLICLVH